MNHVYEKALVLRLEGHSYNEINAKLGVAKSTLSGWFSDMRLPQKAIDRLKKRMAQGTLNGLVKRNKQQTVIALQRAKDIQAKARKEVGILSKNGLFLIGLALYWAEGYKRPKVIKGIERANHPISLTNSDPLMLVVFKKFLEDMMNIDRKKMFVNLRVFDRRKSQAAINYWSKALCIDPGQFDRPSVVISRASRGLRPFNRLPHGTAQLRVADTNEFHRLMGWIDGMKGKLVQMTEKQ
jgi:hypothetical protein